MAHQDFLWKCLRLSKKKESKNDFTHRCGAHSMLLGIKKLVISFLDSSRIPSRQFLKS
jgi:hypothetical protein